MDPKQPLKNPMFQHDISNINIHPYTKLVSKNYYFICHVDLWFNIISVDTCAWLVWVFPISYHLFCRSMVCSNAQYENSQLLETNYQTQCLFLRKTCYSINYLSTCALYSKYALLSEMNFFVNLWLWYWHMRFSRIIV